MAREVHNPPGRLAAEKVCRGRAHYPLVDLLRGISSLVIMIHHLTRYGPQSDHAMELVPSAIETFSSYGSWPVQIFLVISGFVGALSLQRARIDLPGLGGFLVKRYLRLGLPYLATIAYGLLLYQIIPARIACFPLFDSISWSGMLAHAFFLHDIFGYPSLFAGFWYLAIDYQLNALFFALMLLYTGLGRSFRVQSQAASLMLLLSLFLPLACMSIFHWNLNPRYDIYALYFFGTIFLGIVAGWTISGRVPHFVFWGYVVLVILSLIFEWRVRLVVALTTAVGIYLSARTGWNRPLGPVFQWLSRVSYSLFLTHYPTSWAVLSIGSAVSGSSAWGAIFWMTISMVLSLVAAQAMYQLVERPTLRLSDFLVPTSRGQNEKNAASSV